MAELHIGPSGHSFTDETGEPFFWLGDTLWELFRAFPAADAKRVLEKRAAQGFTVIQAMLTGFNNGRMVNAAGELPWVDNDPARPNEAYLRSVDDVLAHAGSLGLIVVLGIYHQMHRASITQEKARAYARFMAARWTALPHVVWTMYPEATADFIPVIRELAAGLREGDNGAHLVTVHPDPSPTSSSFIHDEPWLAFNQMQPWKHYAMQHPMVIADYGRVPPKPVVMAEGGYEGMHYDTVHTPQHVRKQAWWSYLAGGWHTYGHASSHHRPASLWPEWIDAPGAHQVCLCRSILTARPGWGDLVPSQELFLAGRGEGLDLSVAARSSPGGWAMVYIARRTRVTLGLDQLGIPGPLTLTCIDPATGETQPAGVSAAKALEISTPGAWDDALLLVQR